MMTREEAIKEIRMWGIEAPRQREVLETLIPELRESEDERIRKALVKTFEKKLEIGFEWTEFGIPNRSVLDWLEKQKEQKPALMPKRIFPKFAIGDTVCRPMWSDHTIREIYVDNYDSTYICVNEEGVESHIPFSEQDEWKKKEQKPVEWSEEDKEILNTIVKYHFDQGEISPKHSKWAAFLKSLRPSWKPSEEQMTRLNECVIEARERHSASTSGYERYRILNSLYTDLKKLM